MSSYPNYEDEIQKKIATQHTVTSMSAGSMGEGNIPTIAKSLKDPSYLLFNVLMGD